MKCHILLLLGSALHMVPIAEAWGISNLFSSKSQTLQSSDSDFFMDANANSQDGLWAKALQRDSSSKSQSPQGATPPKSQFLQGAPSTEAKFLQGTPSTEAKSVSTFGETTPGTAPGTELRKSTSQGSGGIAEGGGSTFLGDGGASSGMLRSKSLTTPPIFDKPSTDIPTLNNPIRESVPVGFMGSMMDTADFGVQTGTAGIGRVLKGYRGSPREVYVNEDLVKFPLKADKSPDYDTFLASLKTGDHIEIYIQSSQVEFSIGNLPKW